MFHCFFYIYIFVKDKIQGFVMQNGVKFYFVSFLDGLQRVIMFTEDATSATLALEVGSFMFTEDIIHATMFQKVGSFIFVEDVR